MPIKRPHSNQRVGALFSPAITRQKAGESRHTNKPRAAACKALTAAVTCCRPPLPTATCRHPAARRRPANLCPTSSPPHTVLADPNRPQPTPANAPARCAAAPIAPSKKRLYSRRARIKTPLSVICLYRSASVCIRLTGRKRGAGPRYPVPGTRSQCAGRCDHCPSMPSRGRPSRSNRRRSARSVGSSDICMAYSCTRI